MSAQQVFAVPSENLRNRTDVNFALLGQKVSRSLLRSRYPLKDVASLVDSIDYGSSDRADSEPSGVPMIRMNNMQGDGWDLSDLKYLPQERVDLTRFGLVAGDVVVNRTNTKALVGKAAVWGLPGSWMFASYLLRLRVKPEMIRPGFLSAFLNSSLGRLQVDQVSRQIAGMTNINTQELGAIRVPMPKPSQQDKLIRKLSEAQVARDTAIEAARHQLADAANAALAELGLAPVLRRRQLRFAVSQRLIDAAGRLDPAAFESERVAAREAIRQASGEGLSSVKLGEVVDIISDRVGPEAEEPYVGLGDVISQLGQLATEPEPVAAASSLKFQEGDVLYGRLRPALNKVWLADRTGVCSTEFRVLRLRSHHDNDAGYLALCLRSWTTLAQTVPMASGNTHPRISDADLRDTLVPWADDPARRLRLVEQAVAVIGTVSAARTAAVGRWELAKQSFVAALTEVGPND